MAAAGHPGEDQALFEAVQAVGMELCPALGIVIPVGKDSMSMKTRWSEDGEQKAVTAPLSLIVSAFAPVTDVRLCVTPQICMRQDDSLLLLVDLGCGRNRLGASALAQVHAQVGDQAPDLEDAALMSGFFAAIQGCLEQRQLLAYHDRSDGGLFVTLCEMAFAGRAGLDIDISALPGDELAVLFNEELGAVLQVRAADLPAVQARFAAAGLAGHTHVIGRPVVGEQILLRRGEQQVYAQSRTVLHRSWAELSFRMQQLRDNPQCAVQEYEGLLDSIDPGLSAQLSFDVSEDVAAPWIGAASRPRVAILREQGVNGQYEMAAAFERAGFEPVDVHMSDILSGSLALGDFKGLAACGGFSYGDVLGAGGGWARSILFNDQARDEFQRFFERADTFALGACNGCQMLSALHGIIPGAEHWPRFARNTSEQYEARVALVRVEPSPSLLLAGMQGSLIPIVVAHGEGRAEFAPGARERLDNEARVALRYVDNRGNATAVYPANPNGSVDAVAAVTTRDGRVTIMMPHPERVFRTVQNSWQPPGWGEDGAWMRMFRNARRWLG
jgi:phosphoribosylformylglycinamidine synthase